MNDDFITVCNTIGVDPKTQLDDLQNMMVKFCTTGTKNRFDAHIERMFSMSPYQNDSLRPLS